MGHARPAHCSYRSSEHHPSATVAVQLWPAPSVTVTAPAGVIVTATLALTTKVTVIAWPGNDGAGVTAAIVVRLAGKSFTVCALVTALRVKSASPL